MFDENDGGMDIEAIGVSTYTVHLTKEDVDEIRKWILDPVNKNKITSNMKDNIIKAICELDITLYEDGKYVESDFRTDDILWSEFEEREPEEILKISLNDLLQE